MFQLSSNQCNEVYYHNTSSLMIIPNEYERQPLASSHQPCETMTHNRNEPAAATVSCTNRVPEVK